MGTSTEATLGLSLETDTLQVYESSKSFEGEIATVYSLHELTGKIDLVFLCRIRLASTAQT